VELIVEDAEFVTMAPGNDAKNSGAESMLVRDGRIAAIGAAAAVRAAAEPGAAVVRLDGATVIPGLDPEEITGIQVLATVVDGTPTYQAGAINFPAA
jgi:predicted amidohydrolase YtcJ